MTDPPADDLTALLAGWHGQARALLPAIRLPPHRSGVLPTARYLARREAVRRLRCTVMPWEPRKQRHLWPALRDHLPDGDAVVDELSRSQRAFTDGLIRLRWIDERDGDEQPHADAVDRGLAYLRCEEALFPRIAREVPADVRREVAARLATPARFEPTQPHPDLPEQPWVTALLSPVVAVADRLRDRITTEPG